MKTGIKRRRGCGDDVVLDVPFTMAFQPIVDLAARAVWGYEALVRGPQGETAASVLSRVSPAALYKFDQACRIRAIEMAGVLFHDPATRLSINFMPNAVYEPATCIRASLAAAARVGFRTEQLLFEFTETEPVRDASHLSRIIRDYRGMGFLTGIDDFGAGYAGLSLLADLQPDILKIDMHLVRGIEKERPRQAIVQALVGLAEALGVTLLAEGVETAGERDLLRTLGISLFQGYLFARPQIAALPPVETGW